MKIPKEERDGRTIIVGVKMDQQSKELLTWVLVKIAYPLDQVIALHILPSSSSSSSSNPSSDGVDKELESMLAVYEGFCNLKQIDLMLKVCKGSSLRRVLVKEVISFAASQLILGVAKNTRTIGPSRISAAKYCAKKLPTTCSVLAVSNGKTVFEREARENEKSDSIASSSSPHQISEDPSLVESPSEQNCSICDSPEETIKKSEIPVSSSNSLEIKELAEVKNGWPVLRKSVLGKDKPKGSVPKGSVVQWAMQFPRKSNFFNKYNRRHEEKDPVTSVDIRDGERNLSKELESLQKYSSICRSFKYEELIKATSNFSPETLIGKGGSSRVYKGCLPDGKQLAVKILKPSEDAVKEFVSEIEIITTLSHKNIVSLIGFCFNKDHLVLVYDLLSRGSLEENLHGEKKDKRVISWAERYKVAVGVAEALDYLHGDNGAQPVIHKDVKSSNILLSDDFEPQLSDFGLATWASASQSLITCSDVAGTFGYLAPEYFIYGRVNEKIDVYAFGVVLLELLSGRKPISQEGSEGQKSLVMWAKPILQGGKTSELLDPSLSNEYDNDQVERMVLAAALCIKRAARLRPRISLVLKLLQGDEETVKWAKSKTSSLEENDGLEDEEAAVQQRDANIRSHINLSLLDIEEYDSTSVSSTDHTPDSISINTSLDDSLHGRWSRSSSFDS